MDMGCWRNFDLLVISYVLRTAGSSYMWNYTDPLTSLELLNYYLNLAMSSGRFAYYAIQRNDTTNVSIFHMSGKIGDLNPCCQILEHFLSNLLQVCHAPKRDPPLSSRQLVLQRLEELFPAVLLGEYVVSQLRTPRHRDIYCTFRSSPPPNPCDVEES